jgi:hypothetical protein
MRSKLISLALVLALAAPLALAQSTEKGKMSFAILGGVNFQNLTGKDNSGDKLTNDMLVGFHAGVNIQVPIAPEFYFQPGVLFTTKGAKNSYGSSIGTYKLSYIEVPLNLVYKGAIGDGFVMLGFGPYIGFGIGGKSSIINGSTTYEKDIVFKSTVEQGDDLFTAYFKSFDAGANILAGYEMSGGLFLQLNAQLGLVKINPADNRIIQVYSDKLSIKNSGFGLSLGYRF